MWLKKRAKHPNHFRKALLNTNKSIFKKGRLQIRKLTVIVVRNLFGASLTVNFVHEVETFTQGGIHFYQVLRCDGLPAPLLV